MSDYDPRSETGIPTEPVGSLPRPSTLQAAYAAYDKGEIDKAALEKEQDAAVEDSIKHLEATGSPIISDGEQRWSSFATYALADTLGHVERVQRGLDASFPSDRSRWQADVSHHELFLECGLNGRVV